MTAPSVVLDVAGLRVAFDTPRGRLVAVDDLSFALRRGRTLGLVGESGSGKTMTGLALLGLVPPPGRTAARYLALDGRDIAGLPPADRRRLRGTRIGMVFQEPMTALNPVMTVGEQIAETWMVHRDWPRRQAEEAAVELLAKVGIADPARRARDYPHRLSGGQRQRVTIAMAIACDPAVLIADEPTTALDVTVQAQILDLLLAMQAERGMAMLFVSHNLAVVSAVADEVAVMYAGRIVEMGPADAVFAQPLHPYTQGLLATVPRIGHGRGPLPTIPGAVPDLTRPPAGCRFAPRCPLASDACRAADPPLLDLAGRRVACIKATS